MVDWDALFALWALDTIIIFPLDFPSVIPLNWIFNEFPTKIFAKQISFFKYHYTTNYSLTMILSQFIPKSFFLINLNIIIKLNSIKLSFLITIYPKNILIFHNIPISNNFIFDNIDNNYLIWQKINFYTPSPKINYSN